MPAYHRAMMDAQEFLAAELEGWRPFEALSELSDAELEVPVEAAHGWSGRDLIAHLVFWQEIAVGVGRDLVAGDASETRRWVDREWDARGPAWNDELLAEWQLLPIGVVRARFASASSDLRAALEAAPSSRWWDDAGHRETILEETTEHYADHRGELAAILAAAGR
jgi:hypothetical protein